MPRVIPFDEIAFSPTARLFEGGGDIDASVFVVEYQRGDSVSLHVHPYPELFVVLDGAGRFTVGGEQVEVAAGNMLVVPPETPHGFACASDDTLRVVSVHPSPAVEQTFL